MTACCSRGRTFCCTRYRQYLEPSSDNKLTYTCIFDEWFFALGAIPHESSSLKKVEIVGKEAITRSRTHSLFNDVLTIKVFIVFDL